MTLGKLEEGEMFLPIRDWRKALRTSPPYRIGKSSNRFQMRLLLGLGVLGVILMYLFFSSDTENEVTPQSDPYKISSKDDFCPKRWKYNATYPITKPNMVHDSIHFKIGLVSDLDQNSRSKHESNTWVSYYLQGVLVWNPHAQTVSVNFDKKNFKTLKTKFSHNGRCMELSELVTFDGKLLSFDDRTGLVFIIEDSKAHPWLLLMDGDGKTDKGFKTEWATVKDEHLYIGSMGKEWTTPSGEFVGFNPMYVKRISPNGEVQSLDWKENYLALRGKLGINFPGYMIHESAVWSDIHKKWFFLPRRLSHHAYNEETDETQGTNILLMADEHFKDIQATHIGDVIPTHGFSSFKFIPGSHDEVIVALKTTEYKGKISTYIMVFTIHGKILLGETKIDDTKYEGLEFI